MNTETITAQLPYTLESGYFGPFHASAFETTPVPEHQE